MAEERPKRRLAAILASDVVGYSRLMGVNEERTLAQLQAHQRELLEPSISEHRGRIVKTTGDGMLVEFASVVDALRCATEIQKDMTERNAEVPTAERIEFRIGINVGDIMSEGGDIFGDGVNVAARLEALADPGGICVSGRVRRTREANSTFPLRIGANSGSRTSPGRCGSTMCGSAAKPRRRCPLCRCPIGRRSRFFHSRI